ncbi:MAG: hypothetical protein OHK0040_12030 [bacterium]
MIDLNISFLYQLGLFWLVIIILNNMFFKPMLKYLDYRKNLIDGRKKQAEKILKDIEEQEKFYNNRIKEAKEKGLEYKKSIREEILKAQKEKLEAEQRKLDEEFSKNKNIILAEVDGIKKDMDRMAAELGKTMVIKVLGREVQ